MRILVATVPLTGHVRPTAILVEELVRRGHHVTWSTGRGFEAIATRTGARFVALGAAIDWDDRSPEAAFPVLRGRRGLARTKRQLIEMFIKPMRQQLAELVALGDHDIIVADQAHLGARLYHEQTATPWVGLGVSALAARSKHLAPFGTAFGPRLPAILARFLRWLVDRVLFASVNRAFAAECLAAGLRTDETYFDVLATDLFLQPTVEAFEYPRPDLPPQVRFVGPLLPADGGALPAWWPDVLAARAAGTPVVLITQGTLATDPQDLIAPAVAAIERMNVLAIVTTSAQRPRWPSNARVAPFVPYRSVLAVASAMITNGGYGGVQMALAHGVPLIVAGGSEEKPEIARRVAWSGTGVDLRTSRPSARKVARALRRVLREPSFASRARTMATAMAATNAPLTASLAIEQLGLSRRGIAA